VRVYLPLTLPALAAALDHGSFEVPVGFAVTPALREWYTEGDIEELEYAATSAAARASLRRLTEAATPPRRVVVAAELADGVAALPAAAAGDDDAVFTVDSVEDHELAWYAAQELAVLVQLEG